ncbi:Antitoxin MazE [Burkholderiales bacterium]|nr:Antitoxin MazE [Burkholderiales bacterium]
MATTISERVEKRRRALRQAGLRPVQIWVPDSGAPGFVEECARQCRLVAAADRAEPDLARFMDAAAADLDGWTD